MTAAKQHQYILGHSDHELERLAFQSEIIEPITKGLLDRAGVREGMKVLDIGCGPGDVSMLAARMVGPSGSVIGVDRSADALEIARKRASERGLLNVRFEQGDVASLVHPQAVDVVIGRYILVHMPDPGALLRAASSWLKPGGRLAFHEIDLVGDMYSRPPVPAWDELAGWIIGAFCKALPNADAPLRLTEHFVRAGLPVPELFCEIPLGNGNRSPIYRWMVDTALTLKSRGSGERSQIPANLHVGLADVIRDEVTASLGQVAGPAQICAWVQVDSPWEPRR